MPIYEYACRKCGKCFEELVRNAQDEAGVACPVCGADAPERRLSACAVRMGEGGGASEPAMPPMGGGCGGGGFS
ncbi:MAG: zinc ribbon domain-containing protein [Desulfovibrio sp.]|nr:zinc ribbon domain-containing protein [Desulfovibrio sp.]